MRHDMARIGIAALAWAAGLAGAQDSVARGLMGERDPSARGGKEPITGIELLAIDTFQLGDDAIAIVNTSPPSFTALTGDIPQLDVCPEIEFGRDGFIYALETGLNNAQLHRLTASGGFVKTFAVVFPAGYNVLTAAEWVNGALVVGAAPEAGGNAGIGRLLFDEGANTATFDFGPVDLGIFGALGGIAFDPAAASLYAVTAAGTSPQLLLIDGDGNPTVIGTLMEGSVVAPGMTGLEFGSDGQLYACASRLSGRAGELFIVNRETAQCMSLGQTGNLGIVGLTSRAGCSDADIAEPFGQLDFSDVVAFLSLFGAGCP